MSSLSSFKQKEFTPLKKNKFKSRFFPSKVQLSKSKSNTSTMNDDEFFIMGKSEEKLPAKKALIDSNNESRVIILSHEETMFNLHEPANDNKMADPIVYDEVS